MTDFFDWLTATDSGLSAERLAERFRLSHEEMRRTSEVLAPAFLLGLQRTIGTPAAWQDLLAKFAPLGIDGARAGFASPAGGETFLRSLFGTDALTHAVARQASVATGIAPDVIEKMMPILAVLTMQTMMRMTASAGRPDAQRYPSDGAGTAMAEMLRRSANAVEAFSRPADGGRSKPERAEPPSDYLSGLFSDALRGGFPWMTPPPPSAGGRKPPAGPEAAADPFLAFAPMLEAFSRGIAGFGPAAAPAPAGEPAKAAANQRPGERAPMPPGDPFTPMVEAGQAEYMREMVSLFDRYGARKD